jgi:hypothetical protein
MLIGGTYYPFLVSGTATPTGKPIRIFKVVNNSNATVTISWDNVNAHDICPAGSFFLYDVTTNHSNVEGTQGQYVPKGTQFYASSVAAGVGLVYLVCLG